MKTLPLIMALLAFLPGMAAAAAERGDGAGRDGTPAGSSAPATRATIYKQVAPDGRVVYSDKARAGMKVEETIHVDGTPRGAVWSAVPGNVESAPQAARSTPVLRTQKPSAEAAEIEVTRAEMLLEDARKRKRAGLEPRAEELAAGGDYRRNEAYLARQERLTKELGQAEDALLRAIKARNALR